MAHSSVWARPSFYLQYIRVAHGDPSQSLDSGFCLQDKVWRSQGGSETGALGRANRGSHTELPSSQLARVGGIFITPESTGLCRAGQEVAYLVAGLGLPNEDESVRRDDGQAEVDEDDGPL